VLRDIDLAVAIARALAMSGTFVLHDRFILQDHQMTVIVDIAEMRMRCPRCRANSTILSAVDIRPGFQYLTLRCNSCVILFDAQVATAEGQKGSLATNRRELAPTA
jgi:hypothetical protein